MIVFPARRSAATALAGLGLFAALAAADAATTAGPGPQTLIDDQPATLAQVGPPRRLGPPIRLAPPGGGKPPPAQATPTSPGTPSAVTPTSTDPGAVQSERLDDLDSAAVGLIDSAQGGFGIALWRGSERALIERLLPKLPARTPSIAVRDLAVRLLATRAEAPRGRSSGASLLAHRVGRLVELGEVSTASRLAELVSSSQADPTLARNGVEALFLQNDNAGACHRVREFVRRFDDAYWQRALAFCLVLSGERTRAGVIGDILAERSDGGSAAFFDLIESLSGRGGAKVTSLPDPSGLDLAMMRAANVQLPADVLSADRPAVLKSVALSPNADLDLRLAAGERAFLYGAIDARTLIELYGAVPWRAEDLAKPMTVAERSWGPRGRALLLRGAASAKSPTSKAEMLRRALELGREKGGHDIVVRASTPILRGILPDPALMWFAHDAVLALLSAGHVDRAQVWLRLAETETKGNAQARKAAKRLWAIGRFVAPPTETANLDGAPFATWLRAVDADTTSEGRRKAITLLSLLEALGAEPGPGRWAGFLANGAALRGDAPDIAWSRALNEAATSRRVGETILIALLGLTDNKAGQPGVGEVRAAIEGLRQVGLETEARALALEAAVAYGL